MMYILYNACEDIAILKVVMIIMNVFKMICIIAPIILILLLCVDFGKNVIAGNVTFRRGYIKHPACDDLNC